MRFTLKGRLALLLAALPLTALAQAPSTFPAKPITFIVPFAAGSATDQIGRAIGQGVTEQTGQAVVIENKPGASAMIGAATAARAAPDGYTVLITTNTTHAANEHLYKTLTYHPIKDYAPISLLGKGGQIMVVNPNSTAKSVGDFLAQARQSPGKLSFGSGSSSSRIAGELLQQMAGLTRSPLAPDVPTIAESGVPGYEMGYWFAAYAPAGTPPDVVKRLNELLVKATQSAPAKQFYAQTGTDPASSTPDELAQFQLAESKKWGDIIKKAGIQPE